MINNGGGFTDNPIKYNNSQKPNETEEDYAFTVGYIEIVHFFSFSWTRLNM